MSGSKKRASGAAASGEQRKALGKLMHEAFVELRHLEGEQAQDLAHAFHNLPLEMYGWGNWSAESMRSRLQHYQAKHKSVLGFDYVAEFDEIFNV
jgi:hypothetical protein